MEDIQIIILEPKDWQKYKKIRLEALKEEPEAFLRTYEGESNKPEKVWKERLKEALDENKVILLFIQRNGKIIGMGGVYYEKEELSEPNIWGIYVNREFRGKGLGKKLINNLLDRIYRNLNVKVIKLSVNTNKLPALNLYKQMGFRIIDEKEKVLHKKYDEYLMEKVVK